MRASGGSRAEWFLLTLLAPAAFLISLPRHGWMVHARGAVPLSWRPFASVLLPLGARLRLEEILRLPIRKRIYSVICDRPGVGFRQLQRALPMANGTLEFHLAQLERAGLVAAWSNRGRTCYYPTGFGIRSQGSRPSERQERILEYLQGSPGVSTEEVEVGMGIGQSTASYHLDALRALGLVTAVRVGHALHWFPTVHVELSKSVPQLA